MKPLIAMLIFAVLAACVTPEQRAAERARTARTAETIIQACERSGYPRGTAENIRCATDLLDRMYPGGGVTGAEAAYGAFSDGWNAGNRIRSGIPEPEQRLIISPY